MIRSMRSLVGISVWCCLILCCAIPPDSEEFSEESLNNLLQHLRDCEVEDFMSYADLDYSGFDESDVRSACQKIDHLEDVGSFEVTESDLGSGVIQREYSKQLLWKGMVYPSPNVRPI